MPLDGPLFSVCSGCQYVLECVSTGLPTMHICKRCSRLAWFQFNGGYVLLSERFHPPRCIELPVTRQKLNKIYFDLCRVCKARSRRA